MTPTFHKRTFTVICSLLIVVFTALPAAAYIRIDRIVYNPPGSDTGANSHLNQERVILHNKGTTTRSLGRWTLTDIAGHRYRIPDGFRLAPDAYVSIRTGKGTNGRANLYWGRGWYVWNNTGDRAVLRNSNGALSDSCRYEGGGVAKDCD